MRYKETKHTTTDIHRHTEHIHTATDIQTQTNKNTINLKNFCTVIRRTNTKGIIKKKCLTTCYFYDISFEFRVHYFYAFM